MADVVTFILGSLSLLATPGPTNTLLATSGAIRGVRRSLRLLGGELAGYLLAIGVLLAVVGPMVAAVPAFGVALRIAVVAYLVHLAVTFWRQSELPLDTAQPVTLQRVLVTTLLNPKAIIFAFTLLPYDHASGFSGLLPWLGVLSLLIVSVGTGWIAAGASLQHGVRALAHPGVCYRAGAVVLVLLAGMIGWSAVAMALTLGR